MSGCTHEPVIPIDAEERCLDCALADLDRPPAPHGRAFVARWAGWPGVIEAHRVGLARFVDSLGDDPGGHEGAGIVIGAGGVRYFTQAYVCVSVLRRLGCRLPIELWYLGRREMDPRMVALAAALDVRCVDAAEVARALPRPPRILEGWELKPFAMLHSRFRGVLYLDADNVPAIDPSYLFHTRQQRRHGATFWPDWPPGDRSEWIPPAAWHSVGLEYRPDRALETGQILVDKARGWRELATTVWLNEHSDRYYRVVYGDKDTFLLAWHRLGRRYAMPEKGPGWNGVALLQHDFDGRVVFQHRCADKWRYDGDNARVRSFAHERWCFEALAELRRRWHGVLWSFADQNSVETAQARALAGTWDYQRIGIGARLLELCADGRIGAGAGGCETRWTLRHVDGAPLLVVAGESDVTMLLRRHGDGSWRGRWERHERGEVVLRRA